MKKLLLLAVTALCATVSYAQQKPTGGCGLDFRLTSVIPMPTSPIENGKNLQITLWVKAYGLIAYGPLTVDIDSTIIAKADPFNPWSYSSFQLLTDTIHFEPGRHMVTVKYEDGECGLFYARQSITIEEPSPEPVPQPVDSLALIYPNIHPDDFLSLFPNPAKESINVDGLRPTEVTYTVRVTDMWGRQYDLNGITRYKSLLIIPIAGLPPGTYSFSVVTQERTTNRLVQVIK